MQLARLPSTMRWKVVIYFSQLRWNHSARLTVRLSRFSVVLVDGLPKFHAKCERAGVLWWACLCVCLYVCPRVYHQNYMSDHEFFVHVTNGSGSVILWARCDTLCTSGLWMTSCVRTTDRMEGLWGIPTLLDLFSLSYRLLMIFWVRSKPIHESD